MSMDLFQQLSESDVPPVPEELDQAVHAEVNRWLLLMHLSEMLLRGLPFAAWNLGRAVLSFFCFTLSGTFLSHTKRR